MRNRFHKKQIIFFLIPFLILLSLISYGSYKSIPGDFLYGLKRDVYIAQTMVTFGSIERATLHLNHLKELLVSFKSVQKQNSRDSRLLDIAHEFAFNETLASQNLDKAKKEGQNIKKQAGILCEAVEEQRADLLGALLSAPPELQKKLQISLHVTQVELEQAMAWE